MMFTKYGKNRKGAQIISDNERNLIDQESTTKMSVDADFDITWKIKTQLPKIDSPQYIWWK